VRYKLVFGTFEAFSIISFREDEITNNIQFARMASSIADDDQTKFHLTVGYQTLQTMNIQSSICL
jgi:hypothetical protein